MEQGAASSQSGRFAALRSNLAQVASRWIVQGETERASGIPGLTLYRRDTPTVPIRCVVQPSVAVVLQGAKRMLLGEEVFAYDVSRFLITSLELPAAMQVIEAGLERPYLGLALQLDWRLMAELMAQGNLPSGEPSRERGMLLGEMTFPMLDAFRRLIELLDEPDNIPILGPLILREIHYRLLIGDQGRRLRQIASAGSQSYKIARAIDWLNSNYSQPLSISDLAERVQMSTSNFHHHFRLLTNMSPLQFQKCLRLNEARRFMLADNIDASAAAFKVGYESPTQFNREYSRLFGAPPRRHIEQLRREIGSS
jgi:AraC-like DNA-binding protein